MLRMSEVNEVDHQSMQHMLTEGCVDWQGFGRQIAQEANELLGGADAVLIFDESGFAKKGEASAGVARQWNGRLGKVDNCQVGVFATLCRGDMATLIDTRLYLPAAWCNDDERCKKAAIPEDKQQFQSKTQLALAMLKIAQQRGIQFGYVGRDGGYGKEPAFLRGVDEQGCRFVADVHCDQTIYLQDPGPQVPECPGRADAKPSTPMCFTALTSGRPHRQLMLGSDCPCVRAKKAYWLPITCMPKFGFGMAKKKRRAVGISWCVGKSARMTFPIIVYRMRRWIQPGKSWHGCRRNVSSLNTVFARRKANVAWPTIKFAAGMHGTIIWH
jgi:hypothetical protein